MYQGLNVSMALALTITGGVLQFIGLGFTFAELSAIRAHEWHRLTPWVQAAVWWRNATSWFRSKRKSLVAWLRSIWGRGDVEITAQAAMLHGLSASSGSSATATVTAPRVPPPGISDTERIEWLIHRVQEHDSQLEQLPGHAEEVSTSVARKGDESLRKDLQEEQQARDEERLARLKWSFRRQVIAAVCVVLGVGLSTLGAVLAI